MNWKAVYSDKKQYNSKDHLWKDLPAEGFIKLSLTLPNGGIMEFNGWDFYVLQEIENGVKISYWKDTVANDINGKPIPEPYLDKGACRCFYNDSTATGIEYKDANILKQGIAKELIKAGIWVDDELARELKVL